MAAPCLSRRAVHPTSGMQVQEIKTPTLKLVYEQAGPKEGKPVILLHGWPDSPRTWDKVLPVLHEAGYRTITPYLRGYGPSEFRSPLLWPQAPPYRAAGRVCAGRDRSRRQAEAGHLRLCGPRLGCAHGYAFWPRCFQSGWSGWSRSPLLLSRARRRRPGSTAGAGVLVPVVPVHRSRHEEVPRRPRLPTASVSGIRGVRRAGTRQMTLPRPRRAGRAKTLPMWCCTATVRGGATPTKTRPMPFYRPGTRARCRWTFRRSSSRVSRIDAVCRRPAMAWAVTSLTAIAASLSMVWVIFRSAKTQGWLQTRSFAICGDAHHERD